jgi:butyrate kinase
MKQLNVLAINPGSTSTKFAVYLNEKPVFEETLRYSPEELGIFEKIIDQSEFRKKSILDYLERIDFDLNTLDAVVGRGGALMPVPGGTYQVNENILEDTRIGRRGQHASNLGAHIAHEIASEMDIPSFIVDPPVVDEMCDLARVTGLKGYERESKFHALNQKAVSRRYAAEHGEKYEDLNLIVAHLGGGISIGAHEKGRIIDVNDALLGDAPLSPERAGAMPTGVMVELCMSGKYTKREIMKMLVGKGGFVSHFGTNDGREVSQMAENGDQRAKLVLDAMAYQVSKHIGANAAVLKGKVDGIIITGGLAYDKKIVDSIEERIGFLAPVVAYPGEDELLALAQGVFRVLNGEEEAKIY